MNHLIENFHVGKLFRRAHFKAILIVFGLMFFSSPAFGQGQNPVVFSAPDSLEGKPGDTVAVQISLDVGGNQVSFLGAALNVTNNLLSFIDFTIGPITPAGGFSLTTPAPDSIRMVYFDAGTGPITQNGLLLTIRFKVDDLANEGETSDLLFSDLSAGDPLSNSLPVQNVPGKFMVPFSPADVIGLKWNDINGDGVRDTNEPGLPGWQINLITADSTDTLTAMTDAEGKYAFLAIEHGDYILTEILQPDWVQTFPGDPPFYQITLNPGDLADTLDFGNWQPASIHGTKWHDLDADSTFGQNEPGLPGWEIWLITGDDTAKTSTDDNGRYWFMNLPPGEYKIAEVLQTGWLQSFPKDTVYSITLAQGEKRESLNFGNWQPGEIHGAKWEDSDSSGTRENGEAGLAGWEIWLKGTLAGGAEIADTTETDSLGRYWFTGLTPGNYTIGEVLQSGYIQTFPASATHDTVLVSGNRIEDLDFGNKRLTPTSVDGIGAAEIPETFTLFQNYPNPFNPATTIKFGLPNQQHVRLEVYNMLGKRVAVLLDEQKQAGFYEVEFRANEFSSGVYFYRLSAGAEFVELKKMLLVK